MDDLAAVFFEGNVVGAFEQSLSLGFDADEISGFALNLTFVEVQQVQRSYQSVANLPSSAANRQLLSPANEIFADLGKYVKGLLRACK